MWTAFFTVFAIAFILILWKERDVRYLFYGVFGALFGFMFDTTAVSLGYYSYILTPFMLIQDIPLTVTIAEGFCIAITIYIFEKLIKPRI